jgi:hypothetical protein
LPTPANNPTDNTNQMPIKGVVLLSTNTALRANSARAHAGRVEVEGDDITLDTGTLIEAKGATHGGTVLVGGDWQGSGTMRQATTVSMSADSTIDTSATDNGDGGKVVLWSDVHSANSVTAVKGSIYANGGINGGNGGWVETSGHWLQLGDGVFVSTQALKGFAGEWLLDPENLFIRDGSWFGSNYSTSGTTTYTALSANTGAPLLVTGPNGGDTRVQAGGVTVIRTDTIVSALNSGNVRVVASGWIDELGWDTNPYGYTNWHINSTSANKLTLQAGTSITLNSGPINLPNGTLELLAGPPSCIGQMALSLQTH